MTQKWNDYILYYSPTCPFCIRVLETMKKLGIEMELRQTSNPQYRQELAEGGGRTMVPCLKHPDGTWQYESSDIIDFLHNKVQA